MSAWGDAQEVTHERLVALEAERDALNKRVERWREEAIKRGVRTLHLEGEVKALRADLASERELSEGLTKAVAKAQTERDIALIQGEKDEAYIKELEGAPHEDDCASRDPSCGYSADCDCRPSVRRLMKRAENAETERDVLANRLREVEDVTADYKAQLTEALRDDHDDEKKWCIYWRKRAEKAEADAAALLEALEWVAEAYPETVGDENPEKGIPLTPVGRVLSSSSAGSAMLARVERLKEALRHLLREVTYEPRGRLRAWTCGTLMRPRPPSTRMEATMDRFLSSKIAEAEEVALKAECRRLGVRVERYLAGIREAIKCLEMNEDRDEAALRVLRTTIDVEAVRKNGQPTHRCKVCRALWEMCPPLTPVEHRWKHGDCPSPTCPLLSGFWSLRSARCGLCCDNVAMGDQIEALDDKAEGETT